MSPLLNSLYHFRDLVENQPRMKTLLRNWERTVLVQSEDTAESVLLDFRNAVIASIETPAPSGIAPAITVKAVADVLADIFSGTLNPATEFLDGRLQVLASEGDQVKLDAITLVLWG